MKQEVECAFCHKKFERLVGEINRAKKLKRKIFCSLSCSWKFNPENSKGNLNNLRKGSLKDDLSPFRWFTKTIRQRNKDNDIDETYLKKLWEQQKGICPLTSWQLELPTGTEGWKNEQNIKRASLDRIDSNQGYVRGNVRFISIMANYAKNIFSDKDLLYFCRSVANQHNKN